MEIGPPNILRPDTRPRQTATKQSSGELPSGQAQSQGSAISFTSFMQGSCTRRLMKGGSCAPRARHSCATSRDLTRHEPLATAQACGQSGMHWPSPQPMALSNCESGNAERASHDSIPDLHKQKTDPATCPNAKMLPRVRDEARSKRNPSTCFYGGSS